MNLPKLYESTLVLDSSGKIAFIIEYKYLNGPPMMDNGLKFLDIQLDAAISREADHTATRSVLVQPELENRSLRVSG